MNRIEKIVILLLGVILSLSIFSCREQWDDLIPEGTELGVPILKADLNDEVEVLLEWHSSSDCSFRGIWGDCVPKVGGSYYEVFVKFPGENQFIKLERLGKGSSRFLFPNSEIGKPYEFYVTSHRSGQVTTSNMVMIVPNFLPEYEVLMKADRGRSILFPKVNIQGNKVAYITNYMWDEAGKDFMELTLFIRDLANGQSDLIQKGAAQPRWSADGRKLVYASTRGLDQSPWEYSPNHLKTYDLETDQFNLLNGGMHQHRFPNFSNESQAIFFLSDSLERGRMGIWKLEDKGKPEVLWPNFELPAHSFGAPYHTGFDVSYLSDWIAIDNLKVIDNRPIYNILGLQFSDNIQKKDLVVSEWNDMTPSFSPFDKNLLAFISDRSGSRQVWIVNLSTGELRQASFFIHHDFYLHFEGVSLSWTDQGNAIAVSAISGMDGVLVKVPIAFD